MEISQYKTLSEKEAAILKRVKERDSRTHDQVISVNNLSYEYTEPTYTHNTFDEIGELSSKWISLSRHAETQLLNRLGIPASYYYRCDEELKEANFVHWTSHDLNICKKVLFRWAGDNVRAVFSPRYSPDLDDAVLIPVILNALREACTDNPEDTLSITTFEQSSDFTILRALYGNERVEYKNALYFAGITIINSEVGKSSIWIRPSVHCNDVLGIYNLIDRSMDGCTAIRHTGHLDAERVRNAVIEAKRVASIGIHKVLESTNIFVDDPVEEIHKITKNSNFLAQRLMNIVEEECKHQERMTQLQLAQTILRAVQDLPLFQKYLAERDVGRYLNLFQDIDERMESIGQDLLDLQEADCE